MSDENTSTDICEVYNPMIVQSTSSPNNENMLPPSNQLQSHGLNSGSVENCNQDSDSFMVNNSGIENLGLRGDPKAAKLGDRYETSILTHFAIRCALDKTIRNFQIVYNAKDHGDLDDIVINEDNRFMTCVQLKHKAERSNISLEFKKYEKTYNDVLVPKYQSHIQNGLKLNIIVLSNSNVRLPENMKKIVRNEEGERLENKFSTGNGEVFQLEHVNGADETPEFYKSLYLFSKQSAYFQCKNMLANDLKYDVNVNQIQVLYSYFSESVVGRTEPFTADEIGSVLNECILKPAFIFDNNTSIILNDTIINLFNTALKNKTLITIEKKYQELFISLINQCFMAELRKYKCEFINYCEEIPQKNIKTLFQDSQIKKYLSQKQKPLTYQDLLIVLWQIGRCLSIANYTEYKNNIDFFLEHFPNNSRSMVLIVDNNHPVISKDATIFRNLLLFENVDNATKIKFLNGLKIKVGNGHRTLNALIGDKDVAMNSITPNILLALLNGSLTINNSINKHNIYVPRSLKTNLYTDSIFEIPDILFVIHDDDSKLDLDQFLKQQSEYTNINIVNSKWSIKITREKISNINRNYCCLIKFHEKYLIYAQKCSRNHLERFLEEMILDEETMINDPNIMIKVVSGDAGMGKSYLMDEFQRKLLENGKLPIYFKLDSIYEEMNQLDQNEDAYIKYLTKHLGNGENDEERLEFLKCVVQHNINEQKVVLLLDGFDEAKLDCKVINYISSLNFQIIISTRTHKLQTLVENCDCLHFSLQTFTYKDRRYFFKQSYKSEENKKLNELIQVLEDNVEEALMGIPLQVKHVVDIFSNIDDFLESKDNINILFLYEKFLKKHTSSFCGSEIFLKKFACKFLLGSLLKHIREFRQFELEEVKFGFEGNNKINFIITGFDNHGNPQFVHNTYAEFLCAKYLTEVEELSPDILNELYKQEDLLKVRYFFDVIICKKLKLHSALLLKNNKHTVAYLNDEKCLREIDKFGRTALHIAASYGHRHSQIHNFRNNSSQLYVNKFYSEFSIPEKIFMQLLNTMRCKNIKFSEDNWKQSPLDYALNSKCFDFLEQLFSYFPESLPWKDEEIISELMIVTATCDYPTIFNILFKYKSARLVRIFKKNVLHVSVKNIEKKYSLLHICARNGSHKMLQRLLQIGQFNVNERYNMGKSELTLLETAVEEWNPFENDHEKYPSLISMLIKNGAKDIHQENGEETILHKLAVKIGYDFNNLINSVLPKFLSFHDLSYVNILNADGATCFMLAVKYAHSKPSIQFIEILVKHQVSICFLDKNGCNIWHYFANNIFVNDQLILSYISKYLTNVKDLINQCDYNNRKPLEHILFLERSEQIQKIKSIYIKHEPTLKDINKNISNKIVTDLFISEFVDDFHNPIADDDYNNLKSLENNFKQGKNVQQLLNTFIENGADTHFSNKQNIWQYLVWTSHQYNIELNTISTVIKYHFGDDENNLKINEEDEYNMTPLMFTIRYIRNDKSLDLIKYLINHGAQINKRNKFGWNIWHYLGFNKNLNNEGMKSVAEILMSCFNDNNNNGIDEGDEDGDTPLMIAIQFARNDSIDLIKYFIDHGAQIHKVNKLGKNIWHHLCFNKNLNSEGMKNVSELLMSSFDDGNINLIDEEDKEKRTPLMVAIQFARNESIHLIKYFIEHGAQFNKRNKFGWNIWHYLSFNKNLNNEGMKNVAEILMSSFDDGNINMDGINEEDKVKRTPLMVAI